MGNKKAKTEDFIAWDVFNWSKSIDFWEKNVELDGKNLLCLELGSNLGGLSLWLAEKGNQVICSDLESPEQQTKAFHQEYGADNIYYEAIDATQIPYTDHFDIIVFKSMLGGASREGRDENKAIVMQSIHKALKPGGKLLFAENLEASFLHKFLRKKFVKWGKDWNYLRYKDAEDLLSIFISYKYRSVGFFGAFGKTEKQRNLLGRIDHCFGLLIPKRSRYILIGVAEK